MIGLFGCRHGDLSRAITPTKGPRQGQTYVVCLECGAEFAYDWQAMRLGERLSAPRPKRWQDGLAMEERL